MLEKEYQYYETHKKELIKTYENKYIVIKNDIIIGTYGSHENAVKETLKNETLGTFLVQHCINGEPMLRFTSRVSFA